ncbi:MAG: hypothetical protein AAF481_10255 [Acidobacteriota bacterium]
MKSLKLICALRMVANGIVGGALLAAFFLAGCGQPSEPGPTAATAEDSGTFRAALVVAKSDSTTPTTVCVERTGSDGSAPVSGIDILTLSGLDLAYETAAGGGVLVCRIDSAGCDFPAEGCLCQCESGDSCRFWSYWQRPPGASAWQRAERGGAGSMARDGGVEGWVFGAGDAPPPEVSFNDVCS